MKFLSYLTYFRSVSIVLTLVFANAIFAQDLPKWEVGIGAGGQALNDYRGSKDSQIRAFPFPFFIYRGDFFKADRNGLRGEFFTSDQIELNVSGESALNGRSDDNELREGMPELESAFEFGPSLNVNLTGKDFREGWQFRFPVRAVVTIGQNGVRYRGYTINPRFTYTKPLGGGWRTKFNAGLLYGSNGYHDYFYTVAEEFVTDTRPRYEADAGLSGYNFKAGISRRTKKHFYGLSLRYDNLSNANFTDSPLVETENYFAIGFFAGWSLWSSK